MSGMIYQDKHSYICFEMNSMVDVSKFRPIGNVQVYHRSQAGLKIRKSAPLPFVNQDRIDKALRANELGLKVDVPAPVLPAYVYTYEDAMFEYENLSADTLFDPFSDTHVLRNLNVLEDDGTVRVWTITEYGQEMSCSWETAVTFHSDITVDVPGHVALFCDAMEREFKRQLGYHLEQVKDEERSSLKAEFGIS